MGTLGSASIKLNLDRSQFDSDLKKLQATDAGQIAYRIKLDTKDFERQLKGLSKLVSPVFIPLEIDTKTFDQQIKKLSTSIDPIKVDLSPNVKDFQEKLRRLSNISPVSVDIKVDEAKVKSQFETIGKYAADGFTQGFSGVEGAGKSAIDSMVKSVNKQLGIQSPSKVFREIGKYAIAGLMQGLETVDESKIKGVTNKIEGYFKKSKIKINVDIDASGISGKVKAQAPVSPTEKPADFAKNISKAIEDGFQKAKPKANFLGAIFGGLGSLITVPLAATLRGAFEGIGTPLGLQLGAGVSKAIQSTLGQSIGSLELISQRAVEKSLQAIPAAQSAIVEVIKANPIGGAVVKQLELLQRTLELYSINLSPQKAVKSLATEEERAVASSSATFESQQSQFKSRKKAKASASNEFVSIVEQKGEVDKISELIKKKEQELTAKAKKLQSAQNAIASLQAKQEKLASLPQPKSQAEAKSRIATDTSLKKQITEMSQALTGGSLTIEQDIKDIQSLKDAKNAYLEKLNKQIKILAELGIEKDLSGETAEILKGIDVFEQLLSAQKAVAEVQKNIKTNARTPESIRPKKLQKLEGQAKDAKTNLEQAIASTDATPEQVQKLQKRAAAANKALDLYKLEISDPAKEIENLNQKLASGNAALAKNIQELQARLTQAIPALFRNASQEVVKVGNLNEISLAPSAKNQALELRQKQKQQRIGAVDKLPKLYVDAVQSVSRIVTGKDLEKDKIPNIVSSDKVQGKGHYEAQSNTYRIRPDLYKQIETGDIDQVTNEAVGNVVHEIFHAFQHGFGKAIADQTGKLAVDIVPTPEELLKLGDKIESSVAVQREARKPLSRKLETGANVFQLRNTDRVREELKRNQLKDQALSLGGVAGSKISLTDTNALIGHINKFVEQASGLGIDVSKKWAKYAETIEQIRTKASEVGAKAVNFDSISTADLEGIVKEYQEILKTIGDTKAEVLGFTQKFEEISQRQNTASSPSTEKIAVAQAQKNDSPNTTIKEVDVVKPEAITPKTQELHTRSAASAASPKQQAFDQAFKALKLDKLVMPREDLRKLSKSYGLSKSESLALQAYVSGPYNFINAYLREGKQGLIKILGQLQQQAHDYQMPVAEIHSAYGGKFDVGIDDLEKYIADISHFIADTLEKIPNFKGVVFRGEGMAEKAEDVQARIEKIKSEGVTEAAAFTSSGIDAPFKGKAQYVTKSRKGKVIQSTDVVDGGASGETLHSPGTKFRVVGTQKANQPLKIPNIFDEQEIKKINQVLSPENLKKVGAQVIVYLEEVDAAIVAKSEEIKNLDILPQTQSFKEELVIQNSKPQLARVAKELGIKGISSKDKQGLADAIVGSGVAPEVIRSKLPAPTVATEKILAGATKLLQLPSQELEKSTQSAVNSFGLKLKAIAKNPDDKNKVIELQKVLAEIDELEKTYIAAKVKTLDESLQNVFQGRILGLQKQRVAATYQLKPLVGKNLANQASVAGVTQSVVDAEISSERKNLDNLRTTLPTPPPPPGFNLPIGKPKTTLPPPPPGFNLPIGNKSTRLTPPAPPDFNLPIKVKQLVDKVKDSGELFKIITDIQKDQTKNILQKLKEYDQIIKIYDDLEAEKTKQNQALDDKFDPEKIDRQRETITQRAKLSAKLERKYGMEGLAPEILPERIPELGKTGKSPSILQGIKDIFKSLDNSVAKRVKKRAAQLAIEVDTAIAPSLEVGAIDAGARGDKVEQKQYQKLARQSRAATKGIAKILETPGDLTEKQVKQLDRLTSQLEKVYDAIGRPLPSQGFLESIGIGASGALGLVKSLGGVIKGFLAFSVGMWAQNFFGSIAQESFKAFVELDRLKTALNFASGGTAGGAQNLAFVRKTVEDLRVPLKASAEGFTQLAAASRNSALEGKGTREIFLGISQASTVLSLSADDTQGSILALSQMISKGKVSSEELRQQLGERLPGAMGIAARAMGLTEVEFTRLLDTGQILSQDFLPKFAKQLQAEFGDAAKDASGNAQSAIFGVQNAFLSLQQGIGEGVSPAATAGLNVFAVILKGLSSVAKELGFILLGVTVALGVKMVGALQAVIAQLIATKFATGTLGGGLAQLGQTINNSFSVKLTAGIFAVLEIVNLLNQAINTELVQSFSKAADAAKRAAEETKKAFEKPKPGQKNQGTEPVATSGVGRVADSLIGFLNMDVGPIKGGIFGNKIKTWGEYERDSTTKNIQEQGFANTESLGEARYQLAQFKTGTGEGGKLRGIDAELKSAEEQRAILQAQIKRDFVDKGQTIPADSKRQLDSQNLKITALNDQRSEAAKPLTLELNRTTQKINSIKSQLEQLDNPDNIAALGGEAAAEKQRQNLKIQLEPLKQFKAEMETALGSLRIDPILAFTQSLRKLNLALAEGQEKSELRFNQSRVAIASTQLKGFSTNKLATRNAALQNAVAEQDKNQTNVGDLEKAVAATDTTVNASGFQTTLQRLGVAPDASVAKIDDVLKNTSDEADKGILEKLKSAREQKNKLSEARVGLSESQLKVKQTTQDNSLYSIDESAANSRAATTKAENQNITGIKKALEAKVSTEEVASEKISRIQLASTRSQQKSLDGQLNSLRTYYDQGAISAEEFAKRERDLTTEQTNLEKQESENRLAVQSAVLARRLKEIEFFNKRAEALTATRTTDSTRKNKEKLLSSGLTPQAQDQFALAQTKIDATAASDRVNQIKDRIAQNKQLYKEGSKDARDFMLEQYALNQELAQANLAVVDQKISAEEKYREVVEHDIQRIMQAEENRFKSLTSQLDFQKAGLDLYNQSLERTGKLEESRYNLAKAIKDAATAPLETKRDNANRALDLSRKLKDDNLDPGVRSAVSSQLSQMGFGTNELAILAQRNQIEDEIAAKKLESLKLEQEYQRKALALDLQRQRIAAETAVYDAESAKLAAAKSKLDAEGAMRIAQIKKDPIAIESAKVGLEIAGREIELGDKRLDNAQKNLGIQDELARNATLAQKTTQQTAIDQQLAADKTRIQGEGVEKAEAIAPKDAGGQGGKGTEDKGKGSRRVGRIGETFIQNGRTIKDGVDVTNYQYDETLNRSQGNPSFSDFELPKKIEINQLPELNRKPGENLFEAYGRYNDNLKLKGKSADMPPTDMVTGVLNKAGIQVSDSGYSQFAESLKMANQGIEQQLATLNDRILQLANTPRSLTVQSPNPVDDAAKLMSDMSRGQVMAGGM
ncbi:tape measure protein [Nostoc sp.]|uniref:tape measure protein n=1 Tax=Nostoc sp. TaxID=1180 RepID=UPI002FF32E91